VLVYVATTNAGKLRELRALAEPRGWRIKTFAGYAEPAEGDASYEANAVLKARALHAQLQAAALPFDGVIGDDSGIEAEALNGRPGVLSARYGGEGCTWAERRALLMREVAEANGSRAARFVCVIHFIGAGGRTCTAEGIVAGEIARENRGGGGFSYDAVFEYPPAGKTFAELTEEEKNAISHRAAALLRLIDVLAAPA
jgi:XTP/dITP diphosphohydrolase